MTLREIRSNCGNLQSQPPRGSLLNSSGLFLDFSWITEKPDLAAQIEPDQMKDCLTKINADGV